MGTKMFYKAPAMIFERAKALRSRPTNAEAKLWEYLKTKPLGFKFRRQHPIKVFIVDFFSYKRRLAIEVDGEMHDSPEAEIKDGERQRIIESEGIQVLRFTNDEVINQLTMVIEKIETSLVSSFDNE
jgi:cyclase